MYPYCFWGVITNNQDPDKLNRVTVSVPGEEEAVSEWLPVVTPYAGAGVGLSALPDVDDQVLVVSLDAAQTQMAVLGGVWSEKAKPPETKENADADLNKDGKNALQFIKSRAGALFIFDNTADKEKIQLIAHDGKSRLEFSAADKLVTLSSEHDITIGAKGRITIDAEEIAITSKKQINLNADDVQVSAKKGMTVEAKQEMTLKGSGISLN
ncbi:MAG: phage baseplate assembly protein V [Treponema sp.]|jgi:phage baseplate assembly protein gpV|nr:phage baseplate assembly protein V [Treponema sp.]